MRDTSRDHFARLGLDFRDLWGHWPTLIDWRNVLRDIEVHPDHPSAYPGSVRPDRIKQEFRQAPAPIDYRFPPEWGLPPEQMAQLAS